MNVICKQCGNELVLSEKLLCSSCGTYDIDFSVLYVTLYSNMMENGIDAENATPDEFIEYLQKIRGD